MTQCVVARLAGRRLLNQLSDAQGLSQLSKSLAQKEKPTRVYLGVDPTADGLHVGNLAAVCALRHFEACGFQPIALVGGATGRIGDPSGKSSERSLLSEQEIEKNCKGIQRDLVALLGKNTLVVNNLDWFENMSALDLLRDIGKHFPINVMLARESVKSRLSTGISFTEFSYQLLQGYDFLHLFSNFNARVQLGGSDQWGNILGGIELVRRYGQQEEIFALTIPLLLDTNGQKFGKSAGNAVWLAESKTSNYSFYQFFLRVPEQSVEDLLFRLTDATQDEIAQAMQKPPEQRAPQRLLAQNVTTMVRGENAFHQAMRVTDILFGKQQQIQADDLVPLVTDHHSKHITTTCDLQALEQTPAIQLFQTVGLVKSKSQARRLLAQKGLYINNKPLTDDKTTCSQNTLPHHTHNIILLRVGKKNYRIVHLK